MSEHALLWRGLDGPRMELSLVRVEDDHLQAHGHSLGHVDVAGTIHPYNLEYRLLTGPGFETVELDVSTVGRGWRRGLWLRRPQGGGWEVHRENRGEPPFPCRDGAEAAALDGVVDVDLGLSPMTNTLPLLRTGLVEADGPLDLTVAWVHVPSLELVAASQRYRRDGVHVEFSTATFRARLELDEGGFVVDYPGLAERVRS